VTGPTIVLVHGGGFDSRCWDLTIPHLEHPVLAVDLPGRGSRPEPLESVTFPRCGQAIVEEVDAAGAREVVLVGHSLGGSSIIPAVGRLGERVRHVVFVAAMVPRHGYGTHQEWTEDLRASIDDERHRGRDTMPLHRQRRRGVRSRRTGRRPHVHDQPAGSAGRDPRWDSGALLSRPPSDQLG
jgi:pimeloyl-ACP methyl ester carboxylesterase